MREAALFGLVFGFGLNLVGLYWITEPILLEAAQFWWLVPFAVPGLSVAVGRLHRRALRPGVARPVRTGAHPCARRHMDAR